MKLVEILARELKEWPETKEYARQDYDMEICFSRGSVSNDTTTKFDFLSSRFASDNRFDSDQACGTLYVTRAQWEAERARIAAIEGVSAAPEQANAEAERDQRAQYEQELWDKVALDAQGMIFEAAGQTEQLVDIARRVGLWADAFMEERAKRLKR